MTINNTQWSKLCGDNLECKTMVDPVQKNDRINNPNGGKCLNFAFKAAFAVDLGRRIDKKTQELIEGNENDDPVLICLKFACAFRHDDMWYSGVAFNLDFLFYVLMVMASSNKRQKYLFGYNKSSDKTKQTFGQLAIASSRLVDYRQEPVGANASEIALRRSMNTVTKAFSSLVDVVEQALAGSATPDVILYHFRKDSDKILKGLEDEFSTPEHNKADTVWPWVKVELEVNWVVDDDPPAGINARQPENNTVDLVDDSSDDLESPEGEVNESDPNYEPTSGENTSSENMDGSLASESDIDVMEDELVLQAAKELEAEDRLRVIRAKAEAIVREELENAERQRVEQQLLEQQRVEQHRAEQKSTVGGVDLEAERQVRFAKSTSSATTPGKSSQFCLSCRKLKSTIKDGSCKCFCFNSVSNLDPFIVDCLTDTSLNEPKTAPVPTAAKVVVSETASKTTETKNSNDDGRKPLEPPQTTHASAKPEKSTAATSIANATAAASKPSGVNATTTSSKPREDSTATAKTPTPTLKTASSQPEKKDDVNASTPAKKPMVKVVTSTKSKAKTSRSTRASATPAASATTRSRGTPPAENGTKKRKASTSTPASSTGAKGPKTRKASSATPKTKKRRSK